MKTQKNSIRAILSLLTAISLLFQISFLFYSSALGESPEGSTHGYVFIRSVKSGKYIEVPNSTVGDGVEVCLNVENKNLSQGWKFVLDNNGYYSIRSALDNHYMLALQNGNNINGAKIVIKYISNYNSIPDSAKFCLFSWNDNSGVTYILSKLSYEDGLNFRSIDCQGASTANGTKLLTYNIAFDYDLDAHRLWVFEDTGRSIKTNNWNLVDSGKHCDWDGSSKYMSMIPVAANAWNNSIGKEIFRPDAWNRIEDVKIYDERVSNEDPSVFGTTFSNGKIIFYTSSMDGLESELQRQKVVTHELGHALGLGHNNSVPGSIMTQGALAYGTSLSLDDKASFSASYNTY